MRPSLTNSIHIDRTVAEVFALAANYEQMDRQVLARLKSVLEAKELTTSPALADR